MPMSGEDIVAAIQRGIPDAEVRMTDLAGDNDHWAAHVVSASFVGLSRLARQRLVYQALGNVVGNELHALQLTTDVPQSESER